jgi:hypothetical protein
VIPAAGFIKAQAYVPLNHSRWVYSPLSSPQCVPTNHCFSSAHFIDPFLRAILESSFTPDDNDLFLSNLVDTPSLVSHGLVRHVVLLNLRLTQSSSIDENVPTWHSRELVSVLRTWATDAIVRYAHSPLPSPLRFVSLRLCT